MKSSTFFHFVFIYNFIMSLLSSSPEESSIKLRDDLTKIECNSSSVCKNPYCQINQDGRMAFGCELERSLSPVYFHVQVLKFETDKNYRRMDNRMIPICEIMNHPEIYGNSALFDDMIKLNRILFREFVHPCPFMEIKVENGTTWLKNMYEEELSSGIYKVITTVIEDDGEEIFEVAYYESLRI